MLVRDILPDQPVQSLPQDITVLEAVKIMVKSSHGSILVLDGEAMVGIFTERDLMVRVVAADRKPGEVKLEEVMSRDLFTEQPDRLVKDVIHEMRSRHIRHVPVLEGDKPISMLSIRDLLRAEREQVKQTAKELEAYIRGDVKR